MQNILESCKFMPVKDMKSKILLLVVSCLVVAALIITSRRAPAEEEKEVVPAAKGPHYGGTITIRQLSGMSAPAWDPGLTKWSISHWTSLAYGKLLTGSLLPNSVWLTGQAEREQA